MRLCKCGGEVREHELKGDKVAWTCNSCKRYEIIQREPLDVCDTLRTVKADAGGIAMRVESYFQM